MMRRPTLHGCGPSPRTPVTSVLPSAHLPPRLQLTTKWMGDGELLLAGPDRRGTLRLAHTFLLLRFPLLHHALQLLQPFLGARDELGFTDFQCFLMGAEAISLSGEGSAMLRLGQQEPARSAAPRHQHHRAVG